jgi:hypothetical protein
MKSIPQICYQYRNSAYITILPKTIFPTGIVINVGHFHFIDKWKTSATYIKDNVFHELFKTTTTFLLQLNRSCMYTSTYKGVLKKGISYKVAMVTLLTKVKCSNLTYANF